MDRVKDEVRVNGAARRTIEIGGVVALLLAGACETLGPDGSLDVAEAGLGGDPQVSGSGVFNNECQPPAGSPPDDTGDYPPIDLSGSLDGCWYTYVSASQFNPSGTYIEQGTEIFVGCLNGTTCGTFETTYTFTAKYVDDTFAQEIHGRCEHSIVGGTGDFAGSKGVILFKDDVVNLKFDYRGHISLE